MKFNSRLFSKHVRAHRCKVPGVTVTVATTKGRRTLSLPQALRAAARAAKVSAPTLSRIERGALPDMRTFVLLCAWMGAAPGQYFTPLNVNPYRKAHSSPPGRTE